jgi:Icc-related predicted phosphoesterase
VKDVTFSNGFTNSTSNYDAKTGILALELVNSGETAGTAEPATIHIEIPPSTKEGSQLTYEIMDASLSYSKPKEESFISTYSMEPASVAIKGAFDLTLAPILIGKPAVMTVKNNSNEFMSDAEIFAIIGDSKDPVLLGKTNDKGTLMVDSITNEVENVALYVVKDGKYSFKVNTQTYPALTNETEMKNVISTPTSDPYNTKSLTWMSSPLAKEKSSVIQYAKKAMYDKKGNSSLQTAKGSSSDQVFSGEQNIKKNGMVRVNEATLTGLQQDTTYVYRIGDGTNWSEMQEFTTLKKKKTFEFAVLGDTQSPADLSLFNTILGNLDKKDLAFMIHVGDLVDESAKFKQWDDALSVIGQHPNIASTDLVAALGNHEYMGDADGHLAKAIFNSPENGPDVDKGGTYSVDYNNIHISVLGYTDDSKILDKQLEWLKQDVKNSKQPWKILVTHKPPYYTNPFGGNAIMKEKLPPVVDELGIDIVFSGHDHSYGRTKKLKNGKEDPNGTVYVVAGTTGQKHYDAVADEKFDFVNMENIAVSMHAQVNNNQITFTTISSDGKTIDQFTIENAKDDEEKDE